MKKIGLAAVVLLFILIGIFVWLVAGAGPEHAPQDVQIIDVTPSS